MKKAKVTFYYKEKEETAIMPWDEAQSLKKILDEESRYRPIKFYASIVEIIDEEIKIVDLNGIPPILKIVNKYTSIKVENAAIHYVKIREFLEKKSPETYNIDRIEGAYVYYSKNMISQVGR